MNMDKELSKLKKENPSFVLWTKGLGVIKHTHQTQQALLTELYQAQISIDDILPLLLACDRLCSQAMWLVVHMTYAKNIKLNGSTLQAQDFKQDPQGHTGGSLNMVPAYVGYLTANALSHDNREWLMGQGHCVAAIDAVNLLVANALPVHEQRYPLNDEGLGTFVKDFYSYEITPQGKPASPVGSHVNVNTAGASIEGGYLGFAGLHYVHQPLPGEKLVAFLSDGAFEEQRGSDWAPRWWRSEDCGLVSPIMIANGRRIDQRTTAEQLGGVDYFVKHLSQHHFAPEVFDGRDPAAFAIQILRQERLLQQAQNKIKAGEIQYPVSLPYGIAQTQKGFGFYGAGTNAAHGTPLPEYPRENENSRKLFNEYSQVLFVEENVWREAADVLNNHKQSKRLKERDISKQLQNVKVSIVPTDLPAPNGKGSPMAMMDEAFLKIVKGNPNLRVRVANPDELRSNRFNKSLDFLKHRVTSIEDPKAEAINGAVITALNEEAVICAVLANRRGINIAISYEAFAVKMLGALRQKIIFSRHRKEHKQAVPWLSIPVVATSHVWENGKNEQSHQDSIFCEAMLGEMSDISRVIFPADSASAVGYLQHCFQTHGQILSMVVPKSNMANELTKQQVDSLIIEGAVRLIGTGKEDVQLIAIGAYQLTEAKKAIEVLQQNNHECSLVYIAEPGRFRYARDEWEQKCVQDETHIQKIFGTPVYRVLFCHGRPECFLGILRPLDLGEIHIKALGYINHGGTLDTQGLLFANLCTWAHGLLALINMNEKFSACLTEPQMNALNGKGEPYCVIDKPFKS